MLRLGMPSLFLSPAAAVFLISSLKGAASKGQVFHPTSARPFMQNLLPVHKRRGTFTRRNPSELKALLSMWARVQVLVRCKNGPFPIFWRWETTAVCLTHNHVLSGVWHCIALYAEGLPKPRNWNRTTITSDVLTSPLSFVLLHQYVAVL